MSTTNLAVQTAIIELNGSPIAAKVMNDLVDVRIEQTVGLPSRLSARFYDDDFGHVDGTQFAIGARVTAKFLDKASKAVVVFDGRIVDIGVETVADRYIFEIGALDDGSKLDGGTQTRTFLNMTRSQIIAKIAQECGLTAKVDATTARFPHLTQTTTNRAFVDELVALEGLEWWIDGKALVVAKRASAPAPRIVNGEDLVRCTARFARRPGTSTVVARGWDRQAKRVVTASAPVTHDAPVDGAESRFAADLNQQSKGAGGTNNLLVAPHIADDPGEARALATGYANRMAAGEVTIRGEVIGNPTLKAPGRVEIANMGTRISGTYFLTSVEHVLGVDRPYVTRFTAGGRQPTRMVDLLAGGTLAGASGHPVPLGLTVGIVTNNNDEDGLGRVKVKFPILSDDVESAWARVITPASGTSTGFFFVPEVNDEVLVGFEHGDMRHPVVIGGLWNGMNKPPISAAEAVKNAKVQTWVVKTRTGNTLQFFDGLAAAQAKIVVTHANTQNKVTIEDTRMEIAVAKPGGEFAIKVGNASITISGQGDITLDGTNITLKAKQKIVIDAGLMLEAKAATQAKFLCSGQGLTVSPAMTSVKGAAMVQVQAPMVKVN